MIADVADGSCVRVNGDSRAEPETCRSDTLIILAVVNSLPERPYERGDHAMLLQRGEVRGYDFDRMAVEFTMLKQGKVIPCSVSTAAMDGLEGRRDVKSDQRVDQFLRLRDVIDERASRKFFEHQA